MARNKNALKSGFYSRYPISDEFKKLYEAKRREYLKINPNSDLASKTALLFIQLAQGQAYTERTGLPATSEYKLRYKERQLKFLEADICTPHIPKKNTDRISYGGMTMTKGAPGFEGLQEKARKDEAWKQRQSVAMQKMSSASQAWPDRSEDDLW